MIYHLININYFERDCMFIKKVFFTFVLILLSNINNIQAVIVKFASWDIESTSKQEITFSKISDQISWKRKKHLIAKNLLAINVDIIALQELGNKHKLKQLVDVLNFYSKQKYYYCSLDDNKNNLAFISKYKIKKSWQLAEDHKHGVKHLIAEILVDDKTINVINFYFPKFSRFYEVGREVKYREADEIIYKAKNLHDQIIMLGNFNTELKRESNPILNDGVTDYIVKLHDLCKDSFYFDKTPTFKDLNTDRIFSCKGAWTMNVDVMTKEKLLKIAKLNKIKFNVSDDPYENVSRHLIVTADIDVNNHNF